MISRARPALKLIALGPISASEYLLAMGGDLETARAALADLLARGLIIRKGHHPITITATGRKTLSLARAEP
jgi:hypothetical protein